MTEQYEQMIHHSSQNSTIAHRAACIIIRLPKGATCHLATDSAGPSMVQVMIDRIESCKSVRILGEMDMDDGQIEGVKRRHVPTFSAMRVVARQSNGLELNLALLPTLMGGMERHLLVTWNFCIYPSYLLRFMPLYGLLTATSMLRSQWRQ